MEEKKDLLKKLPKVDECMGNLLTEFSGKIPAMLVKLVVQDCIDTERQRILRNEDGVQGKIN